MDEETLLAAARAGDVAVRNQLVTSYLPLVARIASERVRPEQMDDARAEGALALMRAIDTYDSARDRPFSSHAALIVRRAVRRWSRQDRQVYRSGDEFVAPSMASMDAPVDATTDDTLHDILTNDAATPEALCVRRDLARRALACGDLTPSERLVIRRHVLEGETLQAVAGSCSHQAVANIKRRAVTKMRAALAS